ncbi:MAG: hypothetical protein LUB59_01455, partial [Candidatus Gastranaerophilales bacterium]|nr:hypothetical protein [Candidatus Gastranaerophilales bacterium]
ILRFKKMAVNKVEYIKDSSVSGFASAGDEVTITNSSAPTISDDVKEGNVENLTKGQSQYLKAHGGSSDNVAYENEDGTTTVTDGTTDELGGDSGASVFAATAASATSAAVTATANIAFGEAINSVMTAYGYEMNSFDALPIGILALSAGTVSAASVALFDSDYNERVSYASASGENIATMQEYIDILNQDIETLNQQADETQEITDETTGDTGEENTTSEDSGDSDTIVSTLAALYAELTQAQEDGDDAKAAGIQTQITNILAGLTPGGAEDSTEEDPLAQLEANNSTAHDLSDYSSNVGDFLKEGNTMGAFGTVNTAALATSAVISTIMTVSAYKFVNMFTVANATAGAALCGTAAGIFSAASVAMGVKTAKEFECGSKGGDVQDSVGNMTDPLAQHDELLASYMNETAEQESDSSSDTVTSIAGAAASAAGTTISSVSSTAGGTGAGGTGT